MFQAFGPYLYINGNSRGWICWSLMDGKLDNLMVADYASEGVVNWRSLQLDVEEKFYIYEPLPRNDESHYTNHKTINNDYISYCLLFSQKEVLKITPFKKESADNESWGVNSVEKLKFNGNNYFYHLDFRFRATEDENIFSANFQYLVVSIPSMRAINTSNELALLTNINSKIGLPQELSVLSPIVSKPALSAELALALDLEAITAKLLETDCIFLSKTPTGEGQEGIIFIWKAGLTFKYSWSIGRHILSGSIYKRNNSKLHGFLLEQQVNISHTQSIKSTLQEKKLLDTFIANCFGLSSFQLRLIINRLIQDAIWPTEDDTKDASDLTLLFLNFLDVHRDDTPPALQTFYAAYHDFMQPHKLASLELEERFYESQNHMNEEAQARLVHIYQFINLIVIMGLKTLGAPYNSFAIPICPEDHKNTRIGRELKLAIYADTHTFNEMEYELLRVFESVGPSYLNWLPLEKLQSIQDNLVLLENNHPTLSRVQDILIERQDENISYDEGIILAENNMSNALAIKKMEVARAIDLNHSIVEWNLFKLNNMFVNLREFLLIIEKQSDVTKRKNWLTDPVCQPLLIERFLEIVCDEDDYLYLSETLFLDPEYGWQLMGEFTIFHARYFAERGYDGLKTEKGIIRLIELYQKIKGPILINHFTCLPFYLQTRIFLTSYEKLSMSNLNEGLQWLDQTAVYFHEKLLSLMDKHGLPLLIATNIDFNYFLKVFINHPILEEWLRKAELNLKLLINNFSELVDTLKSLKISNQYILINRLIEEGIIGDIIPHLKRLNNQQQKEIFNLWFELFRYIEILPPIQQHYTFFGGRKRPINNPSAIRAALTWLQSRLFLFEHTLVPPPEYIRFVLNNIPFLIDLGERVIDFNNCIIIQEPIETWPANFCYTNRYISN